MPEDFKVEDFMQASFGVFQGEPKTSGSGLRLKLPDISAKRSGMRPRQLCPKKTDPFFLKRGWPEPRKLNFG
jgi:hypothetical protein